MTLSALITGFLEYLELERNASQLTIRNYDHYLKRFLDFSGEIQPKEIDLNLIRKYRLYLSRWSDPKHKTNLKRNTQNYFMIALRAFLKYLAKSDIKTLSPEKVELGDSDPRPLKVLDDASLKSLLEAPSLTEKSGIRDRAILETLFSTGLRVSDLTALNRDTFNAVFLSDGACKWLDKYLEVRKDTFKPLFIRFQGKVDPSNAGEKMRLTPRSVQRIVEKYVKKLRLSVKATPHTLRYAHLKDVHKVFRSGNK